MDGIEGRAGVLPPASKITEYRAALRALIARLHRIARKALDEDDLDEITASIILRELELEQIETLSDAERLAARISMAVDRINDRRFLTSLRRLFEDDEASDRARMARGERIEDQLNLFVSRNVRLISRMTERYRALAEAEILREIGQDIEEPLSKRLERVLRISRSKAALIAQDQVQKLNSELSMAKAQAAGAERYEWVTSKDERVRDLHRDLDGKEYLYGEPTGAEGGAAPGIPIRCRCVSSPVF